jgi:hypothetical protein
MKRWSRNHGSCHARSGGTGIAGRIRHEGMASMSKDGDAEATGQNPRFRRTVPPTAAFVVGSSLTTTDGWDTPTCC